MIPKLPSLAGNAISSLSESFGGGRPVRFGMSSHLTIESSSFLCDNLCLGWFEKHKTICWICHEYKQQKLHGAGKWTIVSVQLTSAEPFQRQTD